MGYSKNYFTFIWNSNEHITFLLAVSGNLRWRWYHKAQPQGGKWHSRLLLAFPVNCFLWAQIHRDPAIIPSLLFLCPSTSPSSSLPRFSGRELVDCLQSQMLYCAHSGHMEGQGMVRIKQNSQMKLLIAYFFAKNQFCLVRIYSFIQNFWVHIGSCHSCFYRCQLVGAVSSWPIFSMFPHVTYRVSSDSFNRHL